MFSDMKTSLESSLYLFKFLFHILFLSIASHIFILLFLVAIVAICCEINVDQSKIAVSLSCSAKPLVARNTLEPKVDFAC